MLSLITNLVSGMWAFICHKVQLQSLLIGLGFSISHESQLWMSEMRALLRQYHDACQTYNHASKRSQKNIGNHFTVYQGFRICREEQGAICIRNEKESQWAMCLSCWEWMPDLWCETSCLQILSFWIESISQLETCIWVRRRLPWLGKGKNMWQGFLWRAL